MSIEREMADSPPRSILGLEAKSRLDLRNPQRISLPTTTETAQYHFLNLQTNAVEGPYFDPTILPHASADTRIWRLPVRFEF